jgi:hypothetical protein
VSCTEPISWLVLEQYHLDELEVSDRDGIFGHLDGCPDCSEKLRFIEGDLRPLPSLSELEPELFDTKPVRLWWRWLLAGASGIVLVGAVIMAAILPARMTDYPPQKVAYKGGELAMSLVRERGGITTEDPERFVDGDRFKVLLSCPPGQLAWDVAIFQGGEVFYPYEAGTTTCGNATPLPGAFRLTGPGDVTVCVVVGEQQTQRNLLGSAEMVGQDAVCMKVMAVENP